MSKLTKLERLHKQILANDNILMDVQGASSMVAQSGWLEIDSVNWIDAITALSGMNDTKAFALVDRIMPGCNFNIVRNEEQAKALNKPPWAVVIFPPDNRIGRQSVSASTLGRAVVAAFLQVVIIQGRNEELHNG